MISGFHWKFVCMHGFMDSTRLFEVLFIMVGWMMHGSMVAGYVYSYMRERPPQETRSSSVYEYINIEKITRFFGDRMDAPHGCRENVNGYIPVHFPPPRVPYLICTTALYGCTVPYYRVLVGGDAYDSINRSKLHVRHQGYR